MQSKFYTYKTTKCGLYDNIHQNSSYPNIVELLQYEINKRIYYYGDNFSNSWEKVSFQKTGAKQIIERHYKMLKSKPLKESTNLVLSNAYFTVNDELRKSNYEVVIPWWNLKKNGLYLRNYSFLRLFQEISQTLNKAGIQELISKDFLKKILSFIDEGNALIAKHSFRAGFFSNDMGFYERAFIDIFKHQNIPTFIFLHGLPARYNHIDDNRADYLIVWGEKIKESYIKAGVGKNKIIVSGHPNYSNIKTNKLKFSLENILVISKPAHGSPSSIRNDTTMPNDRGNCLLYLNLVQETLVSCGVNNVKLRLHPSENPQWYYKNIDSNFYTLDTDSITNSLEASSLVIGPTSTVLLEAIYSGVNYLIFEPSADDKDLINCPLVSPFDGTDDKIPVAKNQDELKHIIDSKSCVDISVFKDYIAPEFNLSEVYQKIKPE